VNDSYKSRSLYRAGSLHYLRIGLSGVIALLSVSSPTVAAQDASPPRAEGVTIQGTVLDTKGELVGDASVRLEPEGASTVLKTKETRTDAAGRFIFTALPAGRYLFIAEKSGRRSHGTSVLVQPGGDRRSVDLILEPLGAPEAMQFSDPPTFTVAGVMDWTAVGGHGSDSILRTSEDLARETLALKQPGSGSTTATLSESELRAAVAAAPGSFAAKHRLGEFYLRASRYSEAVQQLEAAYRIDPKSEANAYELAQAYEGGSHLIQARQQVQHALAEESLTQSEKADLHRLAGEIEEKIGDPLAAVRQEEMAAHLDPSEQNYFSWGSELLLHRAVWQAAEVFKRGAKAYPESARMLTALGSALFAGALYEDAALRLCEASDLDPLNPEPYLFMGKIQRTSPSPLACIEPKLKRFVEQQPENALANDLYAMAIWKRQGQPADPSDLQKVERLLTKAVTIDPRCVDAYLQLGILAAAQREDKKAIGFFTKAIEVDPEQGEAHYRLGVAYDRTGEAAKARREFLLHDEMERKQAAAVEAQRREIKQFLVVLDGQPGGHDPKN